MLRCSILYIFSLVVGLVAAQTSLGLDVAQCVLTCSAHALVAAGCTLATDVACVCGNSAYQSAATACVRQTCPDILSMVEQGIRSACTGYTGNPSGGPPTITTPAPTSSTRSASSSTLKNARVAGGIGALAAFVGTVIF